MTATLQQQSHAIDPSEFSDRLGVLYPPPTVLRWLLDGTDDAPSREDRLASLRGDLLQVEPQSDGGQRWIFNVDDARVVDCLLDASGRPVSIEDCRSFGRLSVEYEYTMEDQLARETLIQFAAESLERGFLAEHLYEQDGTRQSVRITDLSGRTVEIQSFGALGQLDEQQTLNHAGTLSCREQFQYNAQGFLESSNRQRFDADEPDHPVQDWTETREYSPITGYLLRRTLVERQNVAEPGELPDWIATIIEVIHHDPAQDGVPVRDETQYLERGLFGEPELCQRIVMNYRMIDADGAEATQVIAEDLRSGEVREHWYRTGTVG